MQNHESTNIETKSCCILSKKKIRFLRKNPHCIQFFCHLHLIHECSGENDPLCSGEKNMKCQSRIYNKSSYITDKNVDAPFARDFVQRKLPLTLSDIRSEYEKYGSPVYIQRGQRFLLNPYIGQLKLFIMLVQFLNLYYKSNGTTVIYPGFSPGLSLFLINDMFPNIQWILIDKSSHNKPDSNLMKLKNVKFFNQYLDKKNIHMFKKMCKGKYTLLVSDIRVETSEENIMADNDLQLFWHRTLKPEYSCLKFRLPRNCKTKKYLYLRGDIFLQGFSPPSSTETRLHVRKNANLVEYDYQKYDDMLYFFNNYQRSKYYGRTNSIVKKRSRFLLDHCYNCELFLDTLDKYFRIYLPHDDIKSVDLMVHKILTYLHVKTKLEEYFAI